MTSAGELERRPRTFTQRRRSAIAGPLVRHACFGTPDEPCNYRTLWTPEADEDRAHAEMRTHLAETHLDALGMGRCAVCGRVTDHVRVEGGPTGRAWLCEAHAPARDLRAALAGTPTAPPPENDPAA